MADIGAYGAKTGAEASRRYPRVDRPAHGRGDCVPDGRACTGEKRPGFVHSRGRGEGGRELRADAPTEARRSIAGANRPAQTATRFAGSGVAARFRSVPACTPYRIGNPDGTRIPCPCSGDAGSLVRQTAKPARGLRQLRSRPQWPRLGTKHDGHPIVRRAPIVLGMV